MAKLIEKCSWCTKVAIQYLMHQAFCKDCGDKFRELHKKMNSKDAK